MDSFDDRLHKVETELQRSRRGNRLLVASAVVLACVAGAESAKTSNALKVGGEKESSGAAGAPEDPPVRVVEADRFHLVDSTGRPRLIMQVTEHGPTLTMVDEEGNLRVALEAAADGSTLLFANADGPTATLECPWQRPGTRWELASRQGSTVTTADGVRVQDAAGEGRLNLTLLNGNYPVLGVSQAGQAGPPSIEMTASGSSSAFKIHDPQGKQLFSVSTSEESRATLAMRHPAHERTLQISTGIQNDEGPTMSFFAPAHPDGTGGILPHLQLGLDRDQQPFIRSGDSDDNLPVTNPPLPPSE